MDFNSDNIRGGILSMVVVGLARFDRTCSDCELQRMMTMDILKSLTILTESQ